MKDNYIKKIQESTQWVGIKPLHNQEATDTITQMVKKGLEKQNIKFVFSEKRNAFRFAVENG